MENQSHSLEFSAKFQETVSSLIIMQEKILNALEPFVRNLIECASNIREMIKKYQEQLQFAYFDDYIPSYNSGTFVNDNHSNAPPIQNIPNITYSNCTFTNCTISNGGAPVTSDNKQKNKEYLGYATLVFGIAKLVWEIFNFFKGLL